MSQVCRRDCGSSPVVGSSRNSSSGSPTSAQASDRRCFCLLLEPDDLQSLGDRQAARIEAAKKRQHLLDLQLVGELRLLELDPQARTQGKAVPLPPLAQHLDFAGVGRVQPFEDLDRRRLARAVGAQEPEALSSRDLQVEAGHGGHVTVSLDEATASEGGGSRGHGDW
jgi:hypothetical protein